MFNHWGSLSCFKLKNVFLSCLVHVQKFFPLHAVINTFLFVLSGLWSQWWFLNWNRKQLSGCQNRIDNHPVTWTDCITYTLPQRPAHLQTDPPKEILSQIFWSPEKTWSTNRFIKSAEKGWFMFVNKKLILGVAYKQVIFFYMYVSNANRNFDHCRKQPGPFHPTKAQR